jgi:hypothetical protein
MLRLLSPGVVPEMRAKMAPLLCKTGEGGVMEDIMVDLAHKAVRRCTYVGGQLVKEFMAPLDLEVPAMSMNGTVIRVRLVR